MSILIVVRCIWDMSQSFSLLVFCTKHIQKMFHSFTAFPIYSKTVGAIIRGLGCLNNRTYVGSCYYTLIEQSLVHHLFQHMYSSSSDCHQLLMEIATTTGGRYRANCVTIFQLPLFLGSMTPTILKW